MLMLSMLAAAALAPATPAILLNPDSVTSPSDLPDGLVALRSFGAVSGVQLVVNTKGRAESCKVVRSSGIKVVDDLSCNVYVQRARFRPAVNASGDAAPGVFETNVRWVNGATLKDIRQQEARLPVSERPVDLEVGLRRLPSGATSPLEVSVVAEVSNNGDLAACWPETGGYPAALGKVACQQVSQLAPFSALGGSWGNRAGSVRRMTVAFTTTPMGGTN